MNSNYQNDNNSGKGWALGFGLLAGIAVGYYLNSNEGRAARRKAQVRFDEYGNQISEYGTQLSTKANELAGEYKAKGQQYLETAKTKGQEYVDTAKTKFAETKTKANEAIANAKTTVTEQAQTLKSGATDSANSVADSFKRGMDKAKATIDEKAEKIETIVEKNGQA